MFGEASGRMCPHFVVSGEARDAGNTSRGFLLQPRWYNNDNGSRTKQTKPRIILNRTRKCLYIYSMDHREFLFGPIFTYTLNSSSCVITNALSIAVGILAGVPKSKRVFWKRHFSMGSAPCLATRCGLTPCTASRSIPCAKTVILKGRRPQER